MEGSLPAPWSNASRVGPPPKTLLEIAQTALNIEPGFKKDESPHFEGWGKMEDTLLDVDKAKIGDCREDMDTLLVFAGLFSAVLSAFVLVSYQDLKHDSAEAALHVLEVLSAQLASYIINQGMVNSTVPAYSPASFQPSTSTVLVNVLWFSSLVLSLATASFSILVKQWLHEYFAGDFKSPQMRLRVRHFRRPGLDDWRVFEIAAALPFLLQISLGLFFIGLCVFTANAHRSVGLASLVLVVGWAFFFCFAIIAPLFSARCPYKATFLTGVLSFARKKTLNALLRVCSESYKAKLQPLRESDALKDSNEDHKILLAVDRVSLGDDALLRKIWDCFGQLQLSPEKVSYFVLNILYHRIPDLADHIASKSGSDAYNALDTLQDTLGTLQNSLSGWVVETLSAAWLKGVSDTTSVEEAVEPWMNSVIMVLAAMPLDALSQSGKIRQRLQECIVRLHKYKLPESLVCTILSFDPLESELVSDPTRHIPAERLPALLQWLSHHRGRFTAQEYGFCVQNLLSWSSLKALPLGLGQSLASVTDENILTIIDSIILNDNFLATSIWDAFEKLVLPPEKSINFVVEVLQRRFPSELDFRKLGRWELRILWRLNGGLMNRAAKTLSKSWFYIREKLHDGGDTRIQDAISLLALLGPTNDDALLTLQSFVTRFPDKLSDTVVCQTLAFAPLDTSIFPSSQRQPSQSLPHAERLTKETRDRLLIHMDSSLILFSGYKMLTCLHNMAAWSSMSADETSLAVLSRHLETDSQRLTHLSFLISYVLQELLIERPNEEDVASYHDDLITSLLRTLVLDDFSRTAHEAPLWYLDVFKPIFTKSRLSHAFWRYATETGRFQSVMDPKAIAHCIGERLGLAVHGEFTSWYLMQSDPVKSFHTNPETIMHNTISFIKELRAQHRRLRASQTAIYIHELVIGIVTTLEGSKDERVAALAGNFLSLTGTKILPRLQPVDEGVDIHSVGLVSSPLSYLSEESRIPYMSRCAYYPLDI